MLVRDRIVVRIRRCNTMRLGLGLDLVLELAHSYDSYACTPLMCALWAVMLDLVLQLPSERPLPLGLFARCHSSG